MHTRPEVNESLVQANVLSAQMGPVYVPVVFFSDLIIKFGVALPKLGPRRVEVINGGLFLGFISYTYVFTYICVCVCVCVCVCNPSPVFEPKRTSS